MKRAPKWLLPALILVEAVLVWGGLLDPREAVAVAAALEVLLLAVAGGEVLLVVRGYRRGRAGGLDVWTALEEGLSVMLPRRAARFVVVELRLWGCLFRRAFRKTRPAGNESPYHGRSQMGLIVLMVLVTTPVELLVFELVVPWTWLRWLLLVLGVYAVFWVLGLYASLQALPHRLEDGGIRLRYGVLAETFIPYAEVAGVEVASRRCPGKGDGLHVAPDAAYLAVNGRTDLTIHSREPRALRGFLKESVPVGTIHVAADEPERLRGELERRVAEVTEAVPAGGAH